MKEGAPGGEPAGTAEGAKGERSFRDALKGTKRVYAEMKQMEGNPEQVTADQLAAWKSTVATANKEIGRLARRLKMEMERQQVERCVVREEMRCELVDREANSARTADRFRVLHEKEGGAGRSILERASWSNSAIECSIACLCPHPAGVGPGGLLIQRTD